MLKRSIAYLLLCTLAFTLALNGCGGGGNSSKTSSTAIPTSDPALSGAATVDSLAAGTVTLKDSSVPVQARKATLSSDGTYTFITTGLVGPYILKAEWTDNAGSSSKMYSMATDQPGNVQMRAASISSTTGRTANINQFSNAAMYGSDDDPDDMFDNPDPSRYQRTAYNFESVIRRLSTVLAPLFSLYNITGNPVSDSNESELRAMMRDVRISVNSGMVTVTNRQTSGVIFSGPLSDPSSGTFNAQNMPGGSGGSTACTYTYSAWGACDTTGTQTRTVTSSSPSGCTGTPVLSQSCTYVPPTPSPCTYNYSNWGACQTNNTQTRTVTSSSPAGCTGTPVLSQSCTYVPPVTTCTSFAYSAWGACDTTGNQTRTVTSSSPAGCTGGSPVLSQACTYVPPTCTSFAYSAWGACQSNNTQTRTVTSSSPAGCTGGSPVLSQACTYVPPVTTCTSFAYSAWGACQSNNTQTRTVATSSPAGCTGGSPVLSQACTYVPPTPVCGSCHTIPPMTGQHDWHVNVEGFPCSTCHGSGYSSTTVNAATHMNGTKDVVASLNFNPTTGSCSPGCHNTRTW